MWSSSLGTSGANKDKLKLAAEELIKAASSHVETSLITLSQETVQELKKLLSSALESKLSTINQKLSLNSTESQTTLKKILLWESQLNAVNQKLSVLQSNSTDIKIYLMQHLDAMNENVILQLKHQRIDWAIANASFGSFHCNDSSNKTFPGNSFNGSVIIKEVLFSFRMGNGYDVTKYEIRARASDNSGKDGKAEFRETIVEQLYKLLGTKPRLVVSDEKCVIYYE